MQVKKNQPNLYKYIQNYSLTNQVIETFQMQEKAHGRQTNWDIKVFEVSDKTLQKKWANLQRFIVIDKSVLQKGKANTKKSKEEFITYSTSFRISDIALSAKDFAEGIRGHWGIENRTHWVKDVNFKEDNNGIKNDNGAVNMALLNAISLNYLRQNIDDSIKTAQIKFGQNVKKLFLTIRT